MRQVFNDIRRDIAAAGEPNALLQHRFSDNERPALAIGMLTPAARKLVDIAVPGIYPPFLQNFDGVLNVVEAVKIQEAFVLEFDFMGSPPVNPDRTEILG